MVKKHICFTVDVERDYGGRANSFIGVTEGVPLLLKIFKKYNIKATFFVCGEVAEIYPEIVKKIVAEGHEVGSHAYSHEDFGQISKIEIKRQIKYSKIALEKIGVNVYGFRAPYLKNTVEMFPILDQTNYLYNSSCLKKKPNFIYHNLVEIPITNLKYVGSPMSLSRLKLDFKTLKKFIKRNHFPLILYLHPHELVNIPKKNFVKTLSLFMSQNAELSLEVLEKVITQVFESESFVGKEYVTLKTVYDEFMSNQVAYG